VHWRSIIIAALLAILSACSGAVMEGKAFDHSLVTRSKIVKGVTTKAEVQKLFGDPYNVAEGAGGDTWIYYYRQSGPDNSYADRTLTIEFDGHSVVKNYRYRWKETKSPANRRGNFEPDPLPRLPSL
jgi:outer membrane protein assembly factor BamE (lipoprotein component of BamABCDE complex)